MVQWEAFDPDDYDISFNDEKLAAHGISRYDVMEVLANGINVIRNKRAPDRYRVRGRTDAGRLELIVVVESGGQLRFHYGLGFMNSRKRKLADDQIESEVLTDLGDPSAWDDPIYAPPSKGRRAGAIEMPTTGNLGCITVVK